MKQPRPLRAVWTVAMSILVVLVGGYAAVLSGLTAAEFQHALNDGRPALSRAAPVLGESPPPLARRVTIIIIDGLRLEDSYGLPTLDGLRRSGVDAAAVASFPSWSRPG